MVRAFLSLYVQPFCMGGGELQLFAVFGGFRDVRLDRNRQ